MNKLQICLVTSLKLPKSIHKPTTFFIAKRLQKATTSSPKIVPTFCSNWLHTKTNTPPNNKFEPLRFLQAGS
jgi:hypothetical protein